METGDREDAMEEESCLLLLKRSYSKSDPALSSQLPPVESRE